MRLSFAAVMSLFLALFGHVAMSDLSPSCDPNQKSISRGGPVAPSTIDRITDRSAFARVDVILSPFFKVPSNPSVRTGYGKVARCD